MAELVQEYLHYSDEEKQLIQSRSKAVLEMRMFDGEGVNQNVQYEDYLHWFAGELDSVKEEVNERFAAEGLKLNGKDRTANDFRKVLDNYKEVKDAAIKAGKDEMQFNAEYILYCRHAAAAFMKEHRNDRHPKESILYLFAAANRIELLAKQLESNRFDKKKALAERTAVKILNGRALNVLKRSVIDPDHLQNYLQNNLYINLNPDGTEEEDIYFTQDELPQDELLQDPESEPQFVQIQDNCLGNLQKDPKFLEFVHHLNDDAAENMSEDELCEQYHAPGYRKQEELPQEASAGKKITAEIDPAYLELQKNPDPEKKSQEEMDFEGFSEAHVKALMMMHSPEERENRLRAYQRWYASELEQLNKELPLQSAEDPAGKKFRDAIRYYAENLRDPESGKIIHENLVKGIVILKRAAKDYSEAKKNDNAPDENTKRLLAAAKRLELLSSQLSLSSDFYDDQAICRAAVKMYLEEAVHKDSPEAMQDLYSGLQDKIDTYCQKMNLDPRFRKIVNELILEGKDPAAVSGLELCSRYSPAAVVNWKIGSPAEVQKAAEDPNSMLRNYQEIISRIPPQLKLTKKEMQRVRKVEAGMGANSGRYLQDLRDLYSNLITVGKHSVGDTQSYKDLKRTMDVCMKQLENGNPELLAYSLVLCDKACSAYRREHRNMSMRERRIKRLKIMNRISQLTAAAEEAPPRNESWRDAAEEFEQNRNAMIMLNAMSEDILRKQRKSGTARNNLLNEEVVRKNRNDILRIRECRDILKKMQQWNFGEAEMERHFLGMLNSDPAVIRRLIDAMNDNAKQDEKEKKGPQQEAKKVPELDPLVKK